MSEASNTIQADAVIDDGVAAQPQQGRKLDPGFRRNIFVIGGVAVALVLVMVLFVVMRGGTSGGDKKTNSVSVALPSGTTDVGVSGNVSPAMQEKINAKHLQEKEEAEARGDRVFIPKDTVGAPQPIASQPQAPSINATRIAPAQTSYQMTDEERQQQERRRQGVERQLGDLLAAADGGGAKPERVQFQSNRTSGGVADGVGSSAVGAGSGGTGARNKGPEIAGGLDILPAETASPIDTYRTKYASARITGGKLDGAFLTGTTTLMEEGLQTQFNMMRFNGKTYAVNAIALDEKTSTDAMNAQIDKRYLERYVMPITMAFVGGYAQAAAQTGTTTILTGGGATSSTPAATSQQARNAGIAAGVQIAQQEVAKEAQKPYQAKLPANTPIGIMFLAPVYESEAK